MVEKLWRNVKMLPLTETLRSHPVLQQDLCDSFLKQAFTPTGAMVLHSQGDNASGLCSCCTRHSFSTSKILIHWILKISLWSQHIWRGELSYRRNNLPMITQLHGARMRTQPSRLRPYALMHSAIPGNSADTGCYSFSLHECLKWHFLRRALPCTILWLTVDLISHNS